ncbi:PRK06851 family protein [Lederbergia panacisoli]|uniref:PRK06851 family protein n=1 Tax=Lederbergia panacisoli TaxID=1255251 RepID=UPI00214B8C2E|nr:PRK06851 family protein [Lederbergia panacisoli]MCR2821248.1 PRK06851 family protein [Lederbergia panacisoli]
MSGKILRYFAGGNTAKGFYNLYDSNLADLERVFILSGKSRKEKSKIIHHLIQKWSESDLPMEIIHSASNPDDVEGLIIRKLDFAIVDGDSPHEVGKEFIGSLWETIDLDQADRAAHLDGEMDEVINLKLKMEQSYLSAYKAYETGLKVHDEWERIYIDQMNFDQADNVAKSLISTLFKKPVTTESKDPRIVRRFLGAATPIGPVDFVDNITEGLHARYFLKGRAGTGKSTILKKIVAEAKNKGYDIEIYHCGFDPESLDMVLVRELGWAVFDSTQPHEYFPTRPGDEVVDMYELTVAPGTDEAFAEEIANIEARYREQMKLGKLYLAEAKKCQDELETIYSKVSKQEQINLMIEELDHLMLNQSR